MSTQVDEHPLTILSAVSQMHRELDRHGATLVRRARDLGMGRQMIATAFGVSRQAVHEKHGRR
jgi:hypothetical protein